MIVDPGATVEAVLRCDDLGTHFVPPFELERRDLPERRMATVGVVPALDELEYDRHRLRLRVEAMLRQQLALQGGEERLAHRVVEAVAGRTHARPHAGLA